MTRGLASYREFTQFKESVAKLLHRHPNYPAAIENVEKDVGNKFKILVLIDLGGSLFFRTDKKDCG